MVKRGTVLDKAPDIEYSEATPDMPEDGGEGQVEPERQSAMRERINQMAPVTLVLAVLALALLMLVPYLVLVQGL